MSKPVDLLAFVAAARLHGLTDNQIVQVLRDATDPDPEDAAGE